MGIKTFIKNMLFKFGFRVECALPAKDTPIRLWETDAAFNRIFAKVYERTIVDKTRCFIIYQCAGQALSIEGDAAEVGVYKGGTAKLLAEVFEPAGKTVHLFDTFTGMPPSDPCRDTYKEGDFGDTTLEAVKAFLEDCKNIRIYKGVFPPKPNPIEEGRFCFVHVDADIYKSVIDCCAFFYPRLTKSGMMIFDDYGFPLCPGAKAAVDEFFGGKKEKPLYLPTGQCVIAKL